MSPKNISKAAILKTFFKDFTGNFYLASYLKQDRLYRLTSNITQILLLSISCLPATRSCLCNSRSPRYTNFQSEDQTAYGRRLLIYSTVSNCILLNLREPIPTRRNHPIWIIFDTGMRFGLDRRNHQRYNMFSIFPVLPIKGIDKLALAGGHILNAKDCHRPVRPYG